MAKHNCRRANLHYTENTIVFVPNSRDIGKRLPFTQRQSATAAAPIRTATKRARRSACPHNGEARLPSHLSSQQRNAPVVAPARTTAKCDCRRTYPHSNEMRPSQRLPAQRQSTSVAALPAQWQSATATAPTHAMAKRARHSAYPHNGKTKPSLRYTENTIAFAPNSCLNARVIARSSFLYRRSNGVT